MHKLFRLPLILLALTGPALAQPDAGHYRRCLANADANPALALDDADSWSKSGGGVPADHCGAVALVSLKRYAEAGSRLDKIAGGGQTLDVAFRVALFDQAGNAWLLAGLFSLLALLCACLMPARLNPLSQIAHGKAG